MKKFDNFTAWIYCQVYDMTNNKITVPNIVSYAATAYNCLLIINESAFDFLNRALKGYLCHELSPNKIKETEIVFISDLKDTTFSNYLQQPKSMLCRKMLRRYFKVKGEDISYFEYKWLPECLCVNK